VEDEMGTPHLEPLERRLEEPCVALDRVREVIRPVGVPEAGHVQRERSRERHHARKQVVPIAPRAGIAMDEDDGLGGIAGAR
jgi:hypothetical protein